MTINQQNSGFKECLPKMEFWENKSYCCKKGDDGNFQWLSNFPAVKMLQTHKLLSCIPWVSYLVWYDLLFFVYSDSKLRLCVPSLPFLHILGFVWYVCLNSLAGILWREHGGRFAWPIVWDTIDRDTICYVLSRY